MATVRPAKPSDRYRWRPANASSSSRLTGTRSQGRALKVGRAKSELAEARTGGDCRPARAAAQKRGPNGPPGPGGRARLLAGPEVRQAADQPPGLGFRVPGPGLGVAHGALGQGVAVDHADVDQAHRGALFLVHLGADVAVGGDLDLLVALQLHRRGRLLLAQLGLDQVDRALEVAPADRRRVGVLGLADLVVLGAGGLAAGE